MQMQVKDKQISECFHKPIPSDGGLSPSLKLFNELMKGWSGFTLTGDEADEGSNEPVRSLRLANPKSYVSLLRRSSGPLTVIFIFL